MTPGRVHFIHGIPTMCLWCADDPEGCIVPVSLPEYRQLAVALVKRYHAEEQDA